MADNPFLDLLKKEETAPPAAATPTVPAPAPSANPFSEIVTGKSAAPPPAAAATPESKLSPIKHLTPFGSYTHDPVNDPEPQSIPLHQMPLNFLKNILPNLAHMAGEAADAVKHGATDAYNHPGEVSKRVAESIKDHLIYGPSNTQVVKGVSDMLTGMLKKYDTWDRVKDQLSNRPAETLMDLSTLTPLGAESKLGKAAEVFDPSKALTTARRATGLAGDTAAAAGRGTVELMQGIDPESLREMFMSGKNITPDVWKTLTKGLDSDQAYSQLKGILDNELISRQHNYLEGMSQFKEATKPLDFDKIDKAVGEAGKIKTFQPPGSTKVVSLEHDPAVADARGKALAEIEKWRALGPEFHTVAGMDALKQSLYSIGEGLEGPGGLATSGSTFVSKLAKSVSDTIKAEAPEYGAVMEKYSDDTNQIKTLMKEFSVKANNDTSSKMQALRKLQKVWRQSADVAHGERTDLLKDAAERSGNSTLLPQLAAEQFHPLFPRGLRRMELAAEMAPAIGAGFVNPLITAGWGARVAAASPRLAGATAYGLGRASSLPGIRSIPKGMEFAERYATPAARAANVMNNGQEGRKRGGFFSRYSS